MGNACPLTTLTLPTSARARAENGSVIHPVLYVHAPESRRWGHRGGSAIPSGADQRITEADARQRTRTATAGAAAGAVANGTARWRARARTNEL
ncbi:hypothetical protein V500_10238 [Pseudogymnoascus sp. VKM F-4518 (FW-2643)]|nr:hypothetical protein V500_10238 [Pseudogymnoascus sp. VKM F-4518 (FW-2643)]